MFETQIEHAPGDRKPLLTIYLQMYKDKVKKLQQDIKVANEPEQQEEEFVVIEDFEKDDHFDFLDKGVVFDDKTPEFEWMIPDEQALRPFFFMKLIQKTIVEGGFLTQQLYVPRAVWEQTHAQIYAIEKKLVFFNDLKNEMRTLGIHKKKGTVSKDFKVSLIPKERSNFDVLAS